MWHGVWQVRHEYVEYFERLSNMPPEKEQPSGTPVERENTSGLPLPAAHELHGKKRGLRYALHL